MPFPTTRIIDPRWSAHHAAVVPTAFNATVTVGYPTGESTYDPETDDTTRTYSTVYEGAARIQALTGQRDVPLAGQVVAGIPYLVQLPAAAPLAVRGGRVKILTAPNDLPAVGDELWVVAALLGSERFARDLLCSDNATDAPSVDPVPEPVP